MNQEKGMEPDILREINDIQERLGRVKRAIRGDLGTPGEGFLHLFGTWKGEIETFLQELYERRARS
jgi:hypothetical protein